MHFAPAGKMGSCNWGMDSPVWPTPTSDASGIVAQVDSPTDTATWDRLQEFRDSSRRLPSLQQHSLIPVALRDVLAIEIFKDRNRVFPRHTGPFLEHRHAESLSTPRRQHIAKLGQRPGIEHQFVRNPLQ